MASHERAICAFNHMSVSTTDARLLERTVLSASAIELLINLPVSGFRSDFPFMKGCNPPHEPCSMRCLSSAATHDKT